MRESVPSQQPSKNIVEMVATNPFILLGGFTLFMLVIFSGASASDRVYQEQLRLVRSLETASEVHKLFVDAYFDCRKANIDKETCIILSTYKTEAIYDTHDASKVLSEIQEKYIEGERFRQQYNFLFAAVTFRAWRGKL